MAFITFEESLENLRESFEQPKLSEQCFIDQALGRVLSEDIIADANSPAYPTSAMDGYAVKHADLARGRITILGDLPAGTYSEESLPSGFTIKTFTGSLMPKGSDTLIPIENVEVEGDEILIKEGVPEGFSVRPVGENYHEGEVLIKRGTKIGFAEIGVLASLNIAQVRVYQRPRVAIVATGSEILDVGEKQTNPSQIRSSNQFTLEALTHIAGALPTRAPLTKDDVESIRETISQAMETHDIVVTTGGVSVGDYDFVKGILQEMEPQYITKGVILKPGQHIKIVKAGSKYIVALPGFPYSSTVTFILYVIPLIKMLMGQTPALPYVRAVLQNDYKKRSKKTEFVACNLSYRDGTYYCDLEGKKSGSSAILTNMLGDTGLMEVPRESGDIEAGTLVYVIDLKAL